MVEFNQLLEDLYTLQRLGIKVGLEHTQKLLEVCGNPQDNFMSIHIAGTNGKGSTSAMIASILIEAGYNVGLYTSPHLIRFNERIRVNGVPILDESIAEFMSQYKSAIDEIESTFFEVTTAMAFDYFNREKVDVAIIETGLGGRLDSTNVLKPKITIISSITADHTEILGHDLKTIAFEKGGIIKKGAPLILSSQSEEVKDVLLEIADRKGVKVTYCNQNDIKNISISETGTTFSWKGIEYETCLIGEHQARNAVLAIEASRIFSKRINSEIIANGLKKVKWPARIQKMHKTLPIFYDVAHNTHGIQVLLDSLFTIYHKNPIGLIALKADKELEQIGLKLKSRFREIIVTSKSGLGLMEAKDLYNSLIKFGIEATLEPDINKAIKIINNAISKTCPGIIFGSHYIGDTIFKEYGFSFDNGVI
ncbi:MAG: bifunctional folylpolyglutamate synthase/dihydrofolate synthase [Candidatus Marinimicrobia bacterium]|nr:bifunctional folylpolyglutamate synthase/dihydrofolate synthase [Candidatus Neomarinimicrobiota bacterium]